MTQVLAELLENLHCSHIKDKLNEKLGFTYYANSCREAYVQHEYAISDPKQWLGYNKYNWGLTASDGPGYTVQNFNGKPTVFQAYIARGYPDSLDDGTIAPTASVSALPFAPAIVLKSFSACANLWKIPI